MIRDEVSEILEKNKPDFEEISDKVWEYAETCFKEVKSSAVQAEYMEKRGFRVSRGAAGMETAFIAEWGSGKPVIAILGENDALAGLSQEAGATEPIPVEEGAPGHGCGHNLLGTGGMEAACAAKEYMERKGIPGTIRYYACPAEEGGGGKVYLVMDGQFKDVDATLAWHPGNTCDITRSGLAVIHAFFKFEGKAAHAAAAHEGRSALDALELFHVGIQFLREHVKPDTYLHYAIRNAGGSAANVVQPVAEGFYYMRSPDTEYLKEVWARMCDVAKGAALMTGTTLAEPEISSAYAAINPNDTLDNVQYENLRACMPIDYTEDELAEAREFVKVGTTPDAEYPFETDVTFGKNGSTTDVADVSWVTPLSYWHGVTTVKGTVGHNWATVAQGKTKFAKRGMHTAAKVIANSVLDLLENPELAAKAGEEFAEKMQGKKYESLMAGCSHTNYR